LSDGGAELYKFIGFSGEVEHPEALENTTFHVQVF
jgi:hypothetical protein